MDTRIGVFPAVADRYMVELARQGGDWQAMKVSAEGDRLEPVDRARVLVVPVPEHLSWDECQEAIEAALQPR